MQVAYVDPSTHTTSSPRLQPLSFCRLSSLLSLSHTPQRLLSTPPTPPRVHHHAHLDPRKPRVMGRLPEVQA